MSASPGHISTLDGDAPIVEKHGVRAEDVTDGKLGLDRQLTSSRTLHRTRASYHSSSDKPR